MNSSFLISKNKKIERKLYINPTSQPNFCSVNSPELIPSMLLSHWFKFDQFYGISICKIKYFPIHHIFYYNGYKHNTPYPFFYLSPSYAWDFNNNFPLNFCSISIIHILTFIFILKFQQRFSLFCKAAYLFMRNPKVFITTYAQSNFICLSLFVLPYLNLRFGQGWLL